MLLALLKSLNLKEGLFLSDKIVLIESSFINFAARATFKISKCLLPLVLV